MDIQALAKQFFDAEGHIRLDNAMTLPAIGELIYAHDPRDKQRTVLRFFDYQKDPQGVVVEYSGAEVHTRILAVAARLQQVAKPGERVAICATNSPEYLFGFLGALYAAMVPVPLFDPTEPGHKDHLSAVIAIAQPQVVLTNRTSAAAVRAHFANTPMAQRPRILAIDALPSTVAASYEPNNAAYQQFLAEKGITPIEATALLQFTSGSTRTPAGVVLSHRNVLSNILQIFVTAQIYNPMRLVSWLPLHHDMGLILVAFALLMGHELEIMGPRDFLFQPQRWLDRLDAGIGEAEVATCIPNFALELVSRPGMVNFENVDLSGISAFIVGSEPVNPVAVQNFLDLAKPHGFAEQALWPTYGLAEASLLAAVPQNGVLPTSANFDREALAAGRATLDTQDTVSIMSCGRNILGQSLTIVDPETGQELADGNVGEIWIAGSNIAEGYLDNPEQTAQTFDNEIKLLAENSRGQAHAEDKWLATGDLGVFVGDDLYITGRIKDLIIIAGRNHYPQDIEITVQEATAQVRPAAVAAFAVPGEDTEQLIILAERELDADPAADAAAKPVIIDAVATAHGIVPAEVRILNPGEIARSSSGKIARAKNRLQYLQQA